MDRKNVFVLGGAIVVGFLVLGLTQALAQRYPPGPGGPVGRFQVVRANADVIVLLDTTTGDLYSALPRDIQPYNARFRYDGRYEKKEEKKEDFRDKFDKKDFDFKQKDPDEPTKGDFKKDFDKKGEDLKDRTKRDDEKKRDFDEKKGDFGKKSEDKKDPTKRFERNEKKEFEKKASEPPR